MQLTKIHLHNFRNFEDADFAFDPRLTLIVGENARGKTSLLEAIYTSIFGTGYRETREEELLNFDASQTLVESIFVDKQDKIFFQIHLLKTVEERVKKNFYVNKTKKTIYAYKQLQTKAVLFAPEQINLITGSPARRRGYFDSVISEVDREYRKRLHSYENAIRRRNKILEEYFDEIQLLSELEFWNNFLVEQANYLTTKRSAYIDYLNAHPSVDGKKFSISYHKDACTKERLKEVFEKEMRLRKTQIGPQKDDFIISLVNNRKKDAHLYGSRSEQRLAVYWLKLNEISYFEEKEKIKPILLLDDVFSELDSHNKKLIMNTITGYQTVITSTEEHLEELPIKPGAVIKL